MTFRIEQDVFWLQVADDDPVPMSIESVSLLHRCQRSSQIIQSLYDICGVEPGAMVAQYAVYLHLRRQISARVEVHHEVKVFPIREGVVELRDERVVWLLDGEALEDGLFGESVP